jgi:hypothetical protein
VSEILPAEDVVKQQNGNYNMKTWYSGATFIICNTKESNISSC